MGFVFSEAAHVLLIKGLRGSAIAQTSILPFVAWSVRAQGLFFLGLRV